MELEPKGSINTSIKYKPLKYLSELEAVKYLYGIYTSKQTEVKNETEIPYGKVFDGYTIVSHFKGSPFKIFLSIINPFNSIRELEFILIIFHYFKILGYLFNIFKI